MESVVNRKSVACFVAAVAFERKPVSAHAPVLALDSSEGELFAHATPAALFEEAGQLT